MQPSEKDVSIEPEPACLQKSREPEFRSLIVSLQKLTFFPQVDIVIGPAYAVAACEFEMRNPDSFRKPTANTGANAFPLVELQQITADSIIDSGIVRGPKDSPVRSIEHSIRLIRQKYRQFEILNQVPTPPPDVYPAHITNRGHSTRSVSLDSGHSRYLTNSQQPEIQTASHVRTSLQKRR